ncbi:hypothetical protein QN412_13750 [Pseudomonas sp. RTB3]|uniref:DUF6957 family protein n=1 Tax=unclassified Pseudomonas TaxID=196821 RepID=UPI002B22C51F|nr:MULTISPECIES: hypothetical protein [unclassified Pseudomonas]MEB0007894.1 hypothetical protein [Pseudomonas sp. RTB2]MEB0018008.1 hypothetical protein [Pseudomonas sp. RTB3]MEB0270194.1 hypothetical protein [Pseudomonas sp. 5B4]
MTSELQEVTELLFGAGEPALGFEDDQVQAEAEAILRSFGKAYCLVKNWILIEVEVSDGYRDALEADGFSPHVLYAANVVLHSAGKRSSGDWVRSTFQRAFSLGYVFETRNTIYLLMGAGLQKKASPKTVLAIVE